MYPRRVDTGNGTQNVNLSLNWAIPSDHEAARKACMANPDHFNYTVDITHQHSMVRLKTGGVHCLVDFYHLSI